MKIEMVEQAIYSLRRLREIESMQRGLMSEIDVLEKITLPRHPTVLEKINVVPDVEVRGGTRKKVLELIHADLESERVEILKKIESL